VNDQVQCGICGKDFDTSADGETLYELHMRIEQGIDKALESVSVRDTHEAMRQLPLPFGQGSRPGEAHSSSGLVNDEELF